MIPEMIPEMILDTNALSAWADGDPAIASPLVSADRLVIPSIVLGEYWFGIRGSRFRERYEAWLREYLPLTEIAAITSRTADVHADIRRDLKRTGRSLPANEVWIAAVARLHSLPILSRDHDFDLVEGIRRLPF